MSELHDALVCLETWQAEDSECRAVEIKIVDGGYTVDLYETVDFPVAGDDMSHTSTMRSAEGETLAEAVGILFPADRTDEQRVREAASEVYRPEGVDIWMRSPNRSLNNATPLQFIAAGDTAAEHGQVEHDYVVRT